MTRLPLGARLAPGHRDRSSTVRQAPSAWRAGAVGIGLALVLTGCAGREPPDGVHRSSKGYRVALPGPDWRVVRESPADLELRHRQARAGMLVNAACDSRLAGRPVDALRREILAGFSDRDVLARDVVRVAGHEAAHIVVDGHSTRPGERVRVELFVLKARGCVYDLVYAAPPADFAEWQAQFQRMVETLALE